MGDRCLPPIAVTGARLSGIDYTPPMASAQVKGAVLLAGLDADGETVVREPVATRAHTEEMLAGSGADVTVEPWGTGRVVRLRRSTLRPVDRTVPGDPSQAAFWAVAGTVVRASAITVDHVHLGAERIGFARVLVRMGADLAVHDDGGGTGSLTVAHAPLVGTTVEASEIPSLDEVPVLAVAAMVARGPTRFRDVGELRVKESDRLSGTVALVEAFGGGARIEGDDLVVDGGTVPRAASVDAHGDHRMAMAAAVAGAACASRAPPSSSAGSRWPPATPGSPPPSSDWPDVRDVDRGRPAWSSPSTVRRARASRRCPGRSPNAWVCSASTPGRCTARWRGPSCARGWTRPTPTPWPGWPVACRWRWGTGWWPTAPT